MSLWYFQGSVGFLSLLKKSTSINVTGDCWTSASTPLVPRPWTCACFSFFGLTAMINNKSHLASVIPDPSELKKKKGHFPPFFSVNGGEFEKATPPIFWWFGHMKTSCCVSAGRRRDLVISEPPVVIYDVRLVSIITSADAPPPLSTKRDGEIINAFVSRRTSLTHLTPFNKWCAIFSHSL